jgi:uncharacterized delta-60 repeat protein
MKKGYLLICALVLLNIAKGQWTNTYNGQGDFSDVFNAIATDNDGNIIQAGYTINPDVSKDILLVKLNTEADTIWTVINNGIGNGPDEATAMTIDNDNNILLTGYQKGSGTGFDIVTLKFNSDGNLIWSVTYNYTSNEFDQGNAIVTDAAGNIYVAGQSDKDATLNNNDDFLIIKYNTSGIQQWAKRTNGFGNSTDRPSAIALDNNDDLLVTGRSNNGVDDDYFTVKYDGATGTELWKKYFDRTNTDRATDIVCNTSNNRVIITGRSSNGDNYDYATVCYDESGNEIWQGIFDYVDDDRATHIGIDNAGNVYVTGQSDANASAIAINYDVLTVKYNTSGFQQFAQSFDGGVSNDDIPAGLITDAEGNIFIALSADEDASSAISNNIVGLKYNSGGTLIWSEEYNSTGSGNDVAKGIAIDGSNKIFICGYTETTPNKNAAVVKINDSGNMVWDYTYDGLGDNGDNVHSIIRDGSNNIYLGGYTVAYEHDRDFLVMKLGAGGTMLWKHSINGTSNTQSTDDAIAMINDNSGNIYATGFVKNSGTGYDIMLVKYNSSGDSIWSAIYNYSTANETDKAVAITLDSESNIYVTGRSDQDASIVSNDDVITLKYNPSGVLLWEKRYNGAGNGIDNAKSIKIATDGNIYITGKTFNGSNYDMLLLKYNAAGVQQWAKSYDYDNGDDEAVSMVINADGEIVIGGNTTTAEGDLNASCVAYNTSGTVLWSYHYDGLSGGNDEIKNITTDTEGNYIMSVTTAPDTNELTLNGDIAVVKIDNSGSYVWDNIYAGAFNDDASEVTTETSNNIIITGQTDNGTDGNTNYDYLTLKYSPDGTLLQTEEYNGTGNASDVPNTLLGYTENFYITGGSNGGASQRDIVTILYGATPLTVTDTEIEQLHVYPNPSNNYFTVSLNFNGIPTGTEVEVKVINTFGQLIQTFKSTAGSSIQINGQNLPSGCYQMTTEINQQIISTNTLILN